MPGEGKHSEDYEESKGGESKSDDGPGSRKEARQMRAELVEKVKGFFYENDEFAEAFEVWADDNCDAIDLTLEETEFKLEYTELHKEYVKMFEDQIEGFIESLGFSTYDFYETLKESNDLEGDQSSNSIFGQIMCATADFDVFMMMMQETKRRKEQRKSTK